MVGSVTIQALQVNTEYQTIATQQIMLVYQSVNVPALMTSEEKELNRKMSLQHLTRRKDVSTAPDKTHTAVDSDRNTGSLAKDGIKQDAAQSISDHVTKQQLLSLNNPLVF